MCLPNILSPVFMFAFIFHCRSFLPCWPLAFLIVSQPLWIFTFFFLQNSSLLFLVTRSSSFAVIHVSVNIKNNVEKDTTLLLFFLSKSPGGHAISFQIKPWVAFGLPYLLIELFYIGMPVVQTDGRSVYDYVITKFSQMGSLPHFFTHGAPLGALRTRELRYNPLTNFCVISLAIFGHMVANQRACIRPYTLSTWIFALRFFSGKKAWQSQQSESLFSLYIL